MEKLTLDEIEKLPRDYITVFEAVKCKSKCNKQLKKLQ